MEKTCSNCKFFCTRDYGYSNYTVTETEVSCLHNKFSPHEESYSWLDPKHNEQISSYVKWATECNLYKEGKGPSFDVDSEITNNDYKDDQEIYQLLING